MMEVHIVHANFFRCRCNSEFCYVCGVKWKECTCANWDEANLLHAARGRAARDNRENAPAPAPEEVAVAARNLQQNHECLYLANSWLWVQRFRRDGFNTRCELGCWCPQAGLEYILECPDCEARSCASCIRHRRRRA